MKVTKIILGSLSSMLFAVALFFTVQNVSYLSESSDFQMEEGFYQLNNVLTVKSVSADPPVVCTGPSCGVNEAGNAMGDGEQGGITICCGDTVVAGKRAQV